jgi:hypothetical protein
MFEMLTDYQIWVSLLTLTALEIVLGIDKGSSQNNRSIYGSR